MKQLKVGHGVGVLALVCGMYVSAAAAADYAEWSKASETAVFTVDTSNGTASGFVHLPGKCFSVISEFVSGNVNSFKLANGALYVDNVAYSPAVLLSAATNSSAEFTVNAGGLGWRLYESQCQMSFEAAK